MEWSNSLLRHFKIQTLLKVNCCMAAISAFRVTQHSQIFSFFFRNWIQWIALYQLQNFQALFNLRRGYFRNTGFMFTIKRCLGASMEPRKSIFNISSCEWLSTSSLKSFDWFWRVIDELLLIYFFIHQHVQHMTSQILLILTVLPVFGLKLLFVKPL